MPTSQAPPILDCAAAPAIGRFYKWQVVAMLWLICFFNYADRQAIFAVFPVLQKQFGFTEEQLGLIGSAFMWVYALAAPVAGYIGDRVSRKKLILGGCLFWSCITALTGQCTRLWHFVFVRALEGGGETFYYPASVSLASDYHSPATRSRALSLHQSSVYIGTIMGSWVGAMLAQHYNWRVGFYFFGSAGVLLSLVLFRFLREPTRGMSETQEAGEKGRKGEGEKNSQGESAAANEPLPALSIRQTLDAVTRSPVAMLLMAVFFGANFVAAVFLTWTPTFLVQKFGFQLAAAGLSGTIYIHLASACSVPLAGQLADVLCRRFAGGRILIQAVGLLGGASFVMLVGHTHSTHILIDAMIAFGFFKGFYDSGIFASLYDVIEPRARASAAGLMNTIGWIGGGLGPLAIGWAALHGKHASKIDNMSDAIALGGYVYLVGAALLVAAIVMIMRPEKRRAGS